jgi:hypothetical protein
MRACARDDVEKVAGCKNEMNGFGLGSRLLFAQEEGSVACYAVAPPRAPKQRWCGTHENAAMAQRVRVCGVVNDP